MAVLNPEAPEFICTNFTTTTTNYRNSYICNYTSFSTHQPTYCNPPCYTCLFQFYHAPPPPPPTLSYNPYYPSPQWYFPSTPSLPYLPSQPSLLPLPPSQPDDEKEVEKSVVTEEILPRSTPPPHKGVFKSFKPRYGFGKGRFETHHFYYNKKRELKWKPKKDTGADVVDEASLKRMESESIEQYGNKTTVMIRNIPNKYSREMLVKFLDEHCISENLKLVSMEEKEKPSAYDFVYLPIDFESKCNKGYAFVNFTEPIAAWRFYEAMNNYKWGILSSKKICEITSARIQGKEALIKHFEQSSFFCETDEYLPAYFEPCRDGSEKLAKQFIVGSRLNPSQKKNPSCRFNHYGN